MKRVKPFRFSRYIAFVLAGGLVSLVVSGVCAQEITLRGFVSDSTTGQPLVGANIILRDTAGTISGTTTNRDGFYQINRIVPGIYRFQVTYIGYAAFSDSVNLRGESFFTRNIVLVPAREELQEVVVSSEKEGGATRTEGGRQRVRPTDLQRIPTPGAGGDLAGYLQSLPGVVSQGDRGGQLYIRGGTPSQNLILVDGLPIYQPFHVVGFYSAFPQEIVSHVDVFAGGFGARYNGRISSVIDVTMRGGNMLRYEGETSLSPFVTGVRVEGPLKKGTASFITSFRSSVIEQTAPTLIGDELPLKFNDTYLKIQNSSSNSRCSMTAMHTFDRGRIDADADETAQFAWTNTVMGGKCIAFASGSSVLVEVNGGLSYISNEVGERSDPERYANAWRITTDLHFSAPVGVSEVDFGFFGRGDQVNYDLEEQFQGVRQTKDFLIGTGGYLSARIPLGERLNVVPGIVLTLPLSYHPGLEPRFRLAWRPWGTDAQVVNAALGLYRQELEGITDERDAGSMFTAWMPTPVGKIRSRALHALLGWQQQVGGMGFSLEGYFKQLQRLVIPRWSTIARFTTDLTVADGTSHGLDARIEYDRKPVYGFVGYGFSMTRYRARQNNFGSWFGEEVQSYHPPHDRRHQLNAVLSLEVGKYRTNLRWQYGTGLPFTRPFGYDSMIDLSELADVRSWYGIPRILYQKPYGGRLPPYHRLDISLERTFVVSFARLTAQAGIINLYNRSNLFYFDLFTMRRVDQLPLLPYFSLKLEYR